MKGVVALVGPHQDPQINAVHGQLARFGARSVVVDFRGLEEGAPFALRLDGRKEVVAYGRVLDDVVAVYVRQVPGAWPPLGRNADGRAVVLKKWMAPFMLAREREAAATGVLMHWAQQGVRMLNPPSSGSFAQNKIFQLLQARALGVPVPRTVVTNDPDEAFAFVARIGRAIAKPAHGGAITRALSVEEMGVRGLREALEPIAASPVIFQERIDGDDVRLMLLDGKVLSCAAIELPGERPLDFRASDAYQLGRAAYRKVPLSSEVRRLAAAWAKRCGLRFAGIDLKRTARGRLVFLECNSSPIYRDQEVKTGDAISEGIARWLAGPRRRNR